jgi:hypothetical protein
VSNTDSICRRAYLLSGFGNRLSLFNWVPEGLIGRAGRTGLGRKSQPLSRGAGSYRGIGHGPKRRQPRGPA